MVGNAVIRAENFYSKGVQKRFGKAQYNGLWGLEINLLRIIEGKMLAMVVFWKLGNEDTLLHGDTLISVRGYKIRP
jgi:hypothetical protein